MVAPASDPGWPRRAAAAGVHLLTASGALWALLALRDLAAGRIEAALGWMAVAMIVDGADGTLARWAHVKTVLPSIDGALLDNLVDYLNYVVVPAFLMLRADLLPVAWALPGAALVCLVSAYQFVQVEAKTEDHFFRGFPSYWNLVAFYLLVLDLDPFVALATVLGLSLSVFVPVRYVYPSRTVPLRGITLALTGLWAVAMAVLLVRYPDAPRWLVRASLVYPVYYVGLSLLFTWRRGLARAGA